MLGIVKVATTGIAVYHLDTFGRRRLLLAGTALMLGASIALALAFGSAHGGGAELSPAAKFGVVLGCCVYTAAYQLSFGPVLWPLFGEMFPAAIRARAIGANVIVQGLANALTSEAFPPMLAALGSAPTFAVHALVCAMALAFVYAFVVRRAARSPARSAPSSPRAPRGAASARRAARVPRRARVRGVGRDDGGAEPPRHGGRVPREIEMPALGGWSAPTPWRPRPRPATDPLGRRPPPLPRPPGQGDSGRASRTTRHLSEGARAGGRGGCAPSWALALAAVFCTRPPGARARPPRAGARGRAVGGRAVVLLGRPSTRAAG